ncbi:uncharacterized protein BDR25DRAFT_362021 [Lindgomyces ingoldianus]|uniref:Uncharacterized protein n=1 Tax=Lindgomyces ingoldianus TaxID=673940 RepID=A0ACB6QC67_9PLEO|nr:uncharacterized protein BDR25DRAFT_362021 [Lindgomyces ingoldianus]KAF2464095.1 hypothetical protein BDR25DRAFT_362021 [Lindgomyces ingoldianus]
MLIYKAQVIQPPNRLVSDFDSHLEKMPLFQEFPSSGAIMPTDAQWILTLRDESTTPFQLILSLYILYAGNRSWAFLQQMVLRSAVPKLPDSCEERCNVPLSEVGPTSEDVDHPPPSAQESGSDVNVKDISPKEAMEAYWGVRSNKPRIRAMQRYGATVRRNLAISAFFVCVFTLILAPLIFYLASEGGNKNPLVVSKRNRSCGQGLYTDAVPATKHYLDCLETKGCKMDILGQLFPETIVSDSDCPFPSNICIKGQKSVRLEHKLLPRDIGYNSPSRISFNHALTCSPINLDPFTKWPTIKLNDLAGCPKLGFLAFINTRHERYNFSIAGQYVDTICTLNGPNKFSSNYSGWKGQNKDRIYRQGMGLHPIPSKIPLDRDEHRLISPHLYRANGTSFVTLFYAGPTRFTAGGTEDPIEDPIFSAHRVAPGDWPSSLYPDREATALACVEQFRFCNPQGNCSTWTGINDDDLFTCDKGFPTGLECIPRFRTDWHDSTNPITEDLFLMAHILFFRSSVQRYLKENPRFLKAKGQGQREVWVDRTSQWKIEVQAWFEASFVRARTVLYNIITRDEFSYGTEWWDLFLFYAIHHNKALCQSLLFRSPKHTNYNVFGLMTTLLPISIPVFWDVYRKRSTVLGAIVKGYNWIACAAKLTYNVLSSGSTYRACAPNAPIRQMRQQNASIFTTSQLHQYGTN